MVTLCGKQPRLLNLYEVLSEFVEHRVEIVTRRTIYFLKKAKIRAHILAGLLIALGSLDEVIELIKKSKTTIKKWRISKKSGRKKLKRNK